MNQGSTRSLLALLLCIGLGLPATGAGVGPAPADTQAVAPSAAPTETDEPGPPSPRFEAFLSTEQPGDDWAVTAVESFPEGTDSIYLLMSSGLERSADVWIHWIGTDVEGQDKDLKLADPRRMRFQPGQKGVFTFQAGRDGFLPGVYRVELRIEGEPEQVIPFQVRAKHPAALWVGDETPLPSGFNIALSALGGKVEAWTSQYDSGRWSAANLIDGAVIHMNPDGSCTSCGWSSQGASVPQEILLSFHRAREALIQAVVIDTRTQETLPNPDRMPRHVEIRASSTGAERGFEQVAGARLGSRQGPYLVRLGPIRARYLKLIFTSNQGGSYTQVGEIQVIEQDGPESILHDLPVNLARPGLGGSLARWTSQSSKGAGVHRLIDGTVETKGWASEDGYLPQDFVFAFADDREALVERVLVHPESGYDQKTWPKRIKISVSRSSPLDGFEEVGTFNVHQQPRAQGFRVGRRARFVQIRVLDNHGDTGRTSLGEIEVIEGRANGYRSILLDRQPVESVGRRTARRVFGIGEDVLRETEPNDRADQADDLVLGRFTEGRIDPLGEKDFYRLLISGSAPRVLDLDIRGRPNIRASVVLSDPSGRMRRVFDPGRVPAERAELSWLLPAGEKTLEVTQPPVSVAMIWDTSGSMAGNTDALRLAVETYLDQLGAQDRVALVRFSDKVEELTGGLVRDKARLRSAIEGKFFAEGPTPLYDSVAKGIELVSGVGGNRAIVLMTDGADTASRLSYPGLWRRLETDRVRLYTIALGHSLRYYLPDIGSTGARMLGHLALATNGRSFFAPTKDELGAIYQRITEDLQEISAYYLKPDLDAGEGFLSVVSTGERIASAAAPRIELILDASGSMRERKRRIDGKLKIEVAKEVMADVIRGLPEGMQVALRIYGRRIRENSPGDCRDTELIFPLGELRKGRMLDVVRGVSALGTTPLAYSLEQAADDFPRGPGENLIILVTDGKEECEGDPAATVQRLVDRGLKVRVNVVGFALAEEKTKQDMRRVAEISGGEFFDAQNREALKASIEKSLAVPYLVLDAAGTFVGEGAVGQGSTRLPEGVYSVVIRGAAEPIEIRDVRIRRDRFTQVALKKEGREVGTRVTGPLEREAAERSMATGLVLARTLHLTALDGLGLRLEPRGPELSILAVAPDSQGAGAGLAAGDRITHLDGRPISSVQDLEDAVAAVIDGRSESANLSVRRGIDLISLSIYPSEATATAMPRPGGGPTGSATRERVRSAQGWLKRLGFNPGPVDGVSGRRTRNAVRQFQGWYEGARLDVTGKLDDATYRALQEAVAKGMRRRAPSSGSSGSRAAQ